MPFNCDVLLKQVKLCTDNCFFYCNGQFVRQIRGLPMGSPLSPLLSNIYMEYFEKQLLPFIVDFEIIWFRYVDDVFAVIPNNLNLDAFVNSLNNLAPSIKFTTEREANNCLPYLAVQVMRGNNNKPCFKVYRKPTHSNLYIHVFSGHYRGIYE